MAPYLIICVVIFSSCSKKSVPVELSDSKVNEQCQSVNDEVNRQVLEAIDNTLIPNFGGGNGRDWEYTLHQMGSLGAEHSPANLVKISIEVSRSRGGQIYKFDERKNIMHSDLLDLVSKEIGIKRGVKDGLVVFEENE